MQVREPRRCRLLDGPVLSNGSVSLTVSIVSIGSRASTGLSPQRQQAARRCRPDEPGTGLHPAGAACLSAVDQAAGHPLVRRSGRHLPCRRNARVRVRARTAAALDLARHARPGGWQPASGPARPWSCAGMPAPRLRQRSGTQRLQPKNVTECQQQCRGLNDQIADSVRLAVLERRLWTPHRSARSGLIGKPELVLGLVRVM